MGNKSRMNGHGEYKRGYRKGLLDALHALTGDLPDVEYVTDEDGHERSASCYGCLVKRHGFDQLAALFRRTMGVQH
jgi:hypothetical protein